MASLPSMHSKMKMPHGWIVRVSKSYPDRVYYFNVQTGDSTWEQPFPSVDSGEIPDDLHEERTAEAGKKHGLPVEEMSRKRDVSGVKKRHCENSDSSDKQSSKKICRPEAVGSPLPLAVVGPVKNNPTNSELNSKAKGEARKTAVLSEKKNLSPNNRFLLDDPVDISIAEQPNSCAETSKFLSLISQNLTDIKNASSLDNKAEVSISETDIKEKEPDDYYLVVDTNIIIGSMNILRKLFHTPFNGKLPHIFIPLVVIQELDNLKLSSIKNRLYKRAKESVQSIKQFIDMRHPRFHGQTVEEVAEWSQPYTMNNDDKIIECCDYLQTKLPESKIIMLTNDINLGNKGLVSDIETLDLKSLIKEYDLKIHLPEYKRKKGNKLKIVQQPIVTKKMEKQVYEKVEISSSNDEIVKMNEPDPNTEANPQIILRANQLLLATLKKLLNSEIKPDFEDSSHVSEQISSHELIDLLKSITTTILTQYDKYFASRYGVKLKKNLLNLKKSWEDFREIELNKDYCLNLLTNIEDIFCSVKRRLRSSDISPEDIQDMRVLILRNFESAVIPKSSNELTCVDKKANVVYNVFEFNWNVIHYLCGVIMDFCGIDHEFSYEKPDVIPSESEIYNLMQELCLSVTVLKTVMSTVVHSKLDKNAPMDKFFKKFEKVLRDLVPSLQVETGPIDMSSFDYTVLAAYCLSPENRDILRRGYVQLLTFHEKLIQAYTSMKNIRSNQIDPDFNELGT